MAAKLTGLEMCALSLKLSSLRQERDEELKRRVSAQMNRVERGEITSHRLMIQIETELDIVYRNRAEAVRRETDWCSGEFKGDPGHRKDDE